MCHCVHIGDMCNMVITDSLLAERYYSLTKMAFGAELKNKNMTINQVVQWYILPPEGRKGAQEYLSGFV